MASKYNTVMSKVTSNIDFFSDDVLKNPYPYLKELRDLGPACYLQKYDLWFIGRYKETANAIRDWRSFSSGSGCGMNPLINDIWSEALICEDPPIHTEKRKLFDSRLNSESLKPVADVIDARADLMVEQLLKKQHIDIVKDIAEDLPIHIVMDLIGWPADVRPYLIELGAHSLNCLGPDNARTHATFPKLEKIAELCRKVYDENTLMPGGFGHTVAQAARAGLMPEEAVFGLLAGYIVAAFDTTIAGIASGCWLFATHPQEWEKVRTNPALVPSAFTEILRLETPIQHFARLTTKAIELEEGVVIPENSRVIISYASANRDERQFQDADKFLADRSPRPTLSFSAGVHTCPGQGLARLEANAVFGALARKVKCIELSGKEIRELDNITRGFESIPAKLYA